MSDYITIQLTQGQTTLISSQDTDLAELKWYANLSNGGFYAARSLHPGRALLHRIILERVLGRELIGGEFPDHINGNTLDNRRENLRVANSAQNSQNRKMKSTNTSGYKGVSYSKTMKKYHAQICHNYKAISLGFYNTPEQAYNAYCKAALELHGEFARFK